MRSQDSIFLNPDLDWYNNKNGDLLISSRTELGDYPASVIDYLHHWAQQRPDTVFLAQRPQAADWSKITYKETLLNCQCLAGQLLQHGVTADHPLMILSGNSIESALLILAGMYIGVPVVPVSPSYSLMSKSFEKLKYIFRQTNPKLIYAENYHVFENAISSIAIDDTLIVTLDENIKQHNWLSFSSMLSGTTGCPDVGRSNPDTVAKILYTSGSTGLPKGVINTHGMLTSNQESLAMIWPFLNDEGHILVDWLPWHHTFGGNHNFNLILRNGATLYIDQGKPNPEGIKMTVKNLSEVSPTLYFNVTAGYEALLPHLEQNEALATVFFKNLKLLFFAAAALPRITWDRMQKLVKQYAPHDIPITSSWGATETAPLSSAVYFPNTINNNIGIPIPGTTIKLAEMDGKLEIRVRGPNITPGYYKDEEKTTEMFDEEGFYRSGDAVKLVDNDDPSKGILFNGRLSENFKLNTGTWVNVNEVRIAVVTALAPLVKDVVVAGQDKPFLSVLLFLNENACMEFVNTNPDDHELLSSNNALKEELISRLTKYNVDNPASSRQIKRLLILNEPPSIDANEITDKGNLNQRKILQSRADKVAALYQPESDDQVLVITEPEKLIEQ